MGFLFKKSDKKKPTASADGHPEHQNSNEHIAGKDQQTNSASNCRNSDAESSSTASATASPKATKRRSSVKRCLSSNSMRKIRELAACLQIVGDEMERKRLSGAYSMNSNNKQFINVVDKVVKK